MLIQNTLFHLDCRLIKKFCTLNGVERKSS